MRGFFIMKFLQKKLVFFTALLAFTTSCVETIIVGSTATGVVTLREKSMSDTHKDIVISTKLGTTFLANGLKNPGNSIDVTVNEGRVLLTGIARNARKASLASELAWKIEGVKEVIDEIQLRNGDNIRLKDFGVSAYDYKITTEIESRLLFSRKVSSINYQITTVNGVVYLLGVAQDEVEINRILSVVSRVRGVKKVVNHIIIVSDKRRHG